MEFQSTPSISSNYVLVVDNNGDMDILHVSYDTLWTDLCIMLQVKFEYEEIPSFTYTDNEEEFICLDSQESYEEALKICRTNSDVLHIQIRPRNAPNLVSQVQEQNLTNKPTNLEIARTALENSLGWVKSTFHRHVSDESGAPSTGDTTTGLLSSQISNEVSNEMRSILQTMNESRAQSLLNEADTSHQSQTTVKEPVCSEPSDISVSISLLNNQSEEEIVVKEPLQTVTNQESQNETSAMNSDVFDKIKEEVRSAIAKELLSFRQQIAAELKPNKVADNDDCDKPSTSGGIVNERPRSPTEIRSDIRKLKQEMKEAKQLKKLKLQKELKELKKKEAKTVSVLDQPKKNRKYAASFICENLLDGSCIRIGQQFVKYWVLKNEGSNTWDYQIELRLIEEKTTDDSSSVDPDSIESGSIEEKVPTDGADKLWGAEKDSVAMPTVESGKTAVIAVSHVAPSVPCVYTSAWRLCHGGKLFGPRIWCKVTVKADIEVASGSQDDSSLLSQDQSFSDKNWLVSRKLSTAEDVKEAGCDPVNMLSFEMTAVGDFNKETAEEVEQNDNNFEVSYPATVACNPSTQIQVEKEKEEKSAPEEVKEEKELPPEEIEPISILVVDASSVLEAEESVAIEKSVSHDYSDKHDDNDDVNDDAQVTTQDTEKHEEYDDVTMDANSDVPSDFEVIPIPECFDTSKPLTEKADLEEEEPASLEAEEAIGDHIPAGDDSRVNDNENVAENVIDDDSNTQVQSSSTPDNIPSSVPIATSSSIVQALPQSSVTSLPPSICTPAPVPQSVLDLDKPYPVQDYSAGYITPVQKTASSQDPLIHQPIPLPRGVLDSDKPWIKPDQIPSPHPRSSSASHLPASERETSSSLPALTVTSQSNECSSAVQSPPATSFSGSPAPETAPKILYPSLADPNDDDEEYSLAPELPTLDSRLPICVPPDCRTSDHAPPSDTNQSPVAANNPPVSLVSPPVSPEVPPQPPRELTPMEQLIDMGFYDIELNVDLLKEFQNDVNKVVHALVFRSDESRSRSHSNARRGGGWFRA